MLSPRITAVQFGSELPLLPARELSSAVLLLASQNICWQEINSIIPLQWHGTMLCSCTLAPSHAASPEPLLLGRGSLENQTSAGWLKGFVYCYGNGNRQVQVKSDEFHWVIGAPAPKEEGLCLCAEPQLRPALGQ